MGYIKHNAIVVVGYEPDIEQIHKFAVRLFDSDHVSNLSAPLTNAYQSFCVYPDGSKEGWDTSQDYDDKREKFFEWLFRKQRSIDAIDVCFGGDDRNTEIMHLYT